MIDLRILLVATPAADERVVVESLRKHGYLPRVFRASNPAELGAALEQHIQLIFVSPVYRQHSIEQTIAALRSLELDIPCIVLLKDPAQLTLTQVMDMGAHDCVAPGDRQRLVPTLERELLAATLRYNIREQVVTDHLLQEIDQYILHKYDLQNVATLVCQRMVELFGFKLVWIGMKEAGGKINIVGSAGVTDYLSGVEARWDETPQGSDSAGTAMRDNRPVALRTDSLQFAHLRERAETYAIHSILAMPLGINGEVIGVLMIYSAHDGAFDKLTVSRLSAFSSRVSVAMLGAQEQQELRLMEVAMSNAANAMFIADRNGYVQWLNEALCIFSGYSAEELIGSSPTLLNSGKHDPAYWHDMWATILSGKPWRGDIINRSKSGAEYTVTQSVSPLFNDKGELTHFLAVQQDISEKRRLEEEIHYLAYHDTLTDLPNRMLFQDRVQQEISQAKRGNTQFAVLFIDLDGFKTVNDTRGHAAGDKMLQIIAERLRGCVREGDTVARLGGDEFTILLRGISQDGGLERVLDKIIHSVSKPCELGEFSATVTASIGISLYPTDATGVEKLLIRADEAMYQAKQAGKNRFVVYGKTEMDGPALEWQI